MYIIDIIDNIDIDDDYDIIFLILFIIFHETFTWNYIFKWSRIIEPLPKVIQFEGTVINIAGVSMNVLTRLVVAFP